MDDTRQTDPVGQACPVCGGETYGYDYCSDYCACAEYYGKLQPVPPAGEAAGK